MAQAELPRVDRAALERLKALRLIDPFVALREHVTAYPELTGRLWREVRERGYSGGYTAVTDMLRDIRPARSPGL